MSDQPVGQVTDETLRAPPNLGPEARREQGDVEMTLRDRNSEMDSGFPPAGASQGYAVSG